jgi:hypothetical protein
MAKGPNAPAHNGVCSGSSGHGRHDVGAGLVRQTWMSIGDRLSL